VIPYVSMPYITAEGAGGPPQGGFFGGWLGRTFDPLFVLKDPNAPDFGLPELALPARVDATRLEARRGLVQALGAPPAGLGHDRRLQDMDGFQARAFSLLTSPATQRAFRIDREDPRTRERYGRNIYGQSVLLARRLIEAGTRVACISWAPDANATWDTHGQNFANLKNRLLPPLDAALSSLIDDLIARGMLERTLVVVMGEFGRSPKVNAAAGRDHWNYGYSLWLAGGGIRAEYVHGSSDKIGARPQTDPVTPAEIIATIYHCLGISPDLELRDQLERPLTVVPHGQPIGAILA
jgi:arylsulfatase A-like enzyme